MTIRRFDGASRAVHLPVGGTAVAIRSTGVTTWDDERPRAEARGRRVAAGAGSCRYYLAILVTEPAPTVRPPSRMAKRRPSSMAIGWISFTVIPVVSPGITISVPSGSVTTLVMAVV